MYEKSELSVNNRDDVTAVIIIEDTGSLWEQQVVKLVMRCSGFFWLKATTGINFLAPNFFLKYEVIKFKKKKEKLFRITWITYYTNLNYLVKNSNQQWLLAVSSTALFCNLINCMSIPYHSVLLKHACCSWQEVS